MGSRNKLYEDLFDLVFKHLKTVLHFINKSKYEKNVI